MKKVGELMTELGFREDAPESVKKAFMESLKNSLSEQEKAKLNAREISEKCPVVKIAAQSARPQQLSFFETELPQSAKPNRKTKGKQAG